MIAHRADVVVCDGFVGNVVIKFFEGITTYIFRSLRVDLQQGPIAPLALLALKPGFDRTRARFDHERYGGAPLLGVKGVSIVSHGRAKARMIEHAIRVGVGVRARGGFRSSSASGLGSIRRWRIAACGPGSRHVCTASGRPLRDERLEEARPAAAGLLARRLAMLALFEAEFRPGAAPSALDRLAVEREVIDEVAPTRPSSSPGWRAPSGSGRSNCRRGAR